MTTVIVYQEHITQADLDCILDGYECIRSPLHDKDIYDTGLHKGELKKPHWHVVFQNGLTTSQRKYFNRCVGLSDNFLHQEVLSGEGILKYLTHEDQENKYHYDKNDIRATDTFDWDYALTYEKHPKQQSFYKEIFQIIIDNDFCEYSDFIEYMLAYPKEEVTDYAFKHEIKFKHFIDSRRYKAHAIHEDRLSDSLMKEREINDQLLQLLNYMSASEEEDITLSNILKNIYEKKCFT